MDLKSRKTPRSAHGNSADNVKTCLFNEKRHEEHEKTPRKKQKAIQRAANGQASLDPSPDVRQQCNSSAGNILSSFVSCSPSVVSIKS